MSDLSEHNHLVVGVSTWGRGRDIFEAMANAKTKKKDRFRYFIFKEDSWDILSDGMVTYTKENLIFRQNFNF